MATEILRFDHVTGKELGFNVEDIDLSLEPGFIYGLMGENGAGKTTLMKMIMREEARYTGNIYIGGEELRKNHAPLMNKVGFVSEDNHFLEDKSGIQNASLLGMFYEDFDMDLFKEAMKKMELSGGKTYGGMSRGEKLKFQLAFAMAHKPCLYLLDEVTAGMDPVFRIDFFAMLQEIIIDESASILMTSHIQSEMELKTDYVGIMREGRIVQFGESIDVIPGLREKRGNRYEQ